MIKTGLFSLLFLLAIPTWAKPVDQLKQEITVLAKANTTEVQNQWEVRGELDVLIKQLTKQTSPVTEQQWLTYSPGSWRQIWSDEADNSPAGSPPRNLDKIFQYVTSDGRAVNFGERVLPNGQRVTFALEAVGAVSGNVQNTKILKAFSRNQGLNSGEYLSVMSEDILSGQLQGFTEIAAGEFPKGPINAESDLTILFLDEDIKIGTAPNVYTGESELFVLERVVSVQ
jgi:hypothetical protein